MQDHHNKSMAGPVVHRLRPRLILVVSLGWTVVSGCSVPLDSGGSRSSVASPARQKSQDLQPLPSRPSEVDAKPRSASPVEAKPAPVQPVALIDRCAKNLPDPAPLTTVHWVSVTVQYDKGLLSLKDVQARLTRHPRQTARRMGRFSAELWIGCELIERVRFDFALLAAPGEEPPRETGQAAPPSFQDLRTSRQILLPDSTRATRLVLRDRATDEHHVYAWPLPAQLGPSREPATPGRRPKVAAPDPR